MTKFLTVAIFVSGLTMAGLPLSAANAQSTMKECAAEWQKMKAAKQTAGKTYKDFSKDCMSKTSATPAAAPAATAAKPAAAPAATAAKPATAPAATAAKPAATTAAAKPTDGRQAMYARERACGQEWKADKAAGKTGTMKWPQYWSDCNKRKKAAGL